MYSIRASRKSVIRVLLVSMALMTGSVVGSVVPGVASAAGSVVLVPPSASYNAPDHDGMTYGDSTWTDIRIEADVSNMATTGSNLSPDGTQDWGNFQIKFRGDDNTFYALNIGLGTGATFVMDSINWTPLGTMTSTPPTPSTSTPVHYQIDAVGNTLSLTVDGTQVWTWQDDYTSSARAVLASGQAGWSTIGTTATISGFTVTYLGDVIPLTSAAVSPIKAPVAGIYPQGLFKQITGAYNETLVWSPQIDTTFATNTVYTVTDTLAPNSLVNTFAGITADQISGVPTQGVTSTNVAVVGDTCVVTITFAATGDTAAQFDPNTTVPLFSDDFNGTQLDMTKWEYSGDLARYDRSGWDSNQVSLDGQGHLDIAITKDPAAATKYFPNGVDPATGDPIDTDNFIVSGAIDTQGLFENSYGYYEASIQFPQVSGTWGAFWMMDYNNVIRTGDQGIDGTEIDVVETMNNSVNDGADSALVWNGYNEDERYIGKDYTTNDYVTPIYDGKFHTYAVDWSPSAYIFYIDGKEMWRTNGSDVADATHGDYPGITQNPVNMLLSVEGAKFQGNLPDGFTTTAMVVDYVKVYDRPANTPAAVDKTALQSLITSANTLTATDYTPDSWAALQTQLTAATTVNADTTATQSAVDSATTALQTAITNLVLASTTAPPTTAPPTPVPPTPVPPTPVPPTTIPPTTLPPTTAPPTTAPPTPVPPTPVPPTPVPPTPVPPTPAPPTPVPPTPVPPTPVPPTPVPPTPVPPTTLPPTTIPPTPVPPTPVPPTPVPPTTIPPTTLPPTTAPPTPVPPTPVPPTPVPPTPVPPTTIPPTTLPPTTAPPTTLPPTTAPPTPTPTPTPGPTILSLRVDQGQTGRDFTFVGSGFAPGDKVSAQIHSTPIDLTPQIADPAGQVTFHWTAPATFPAGLHTIDLSGASGTVSTTFTIQPGPGNPLVETFPLESGSTDSGITQIPSGGIVLAPMPWVGIGFVLFGLVFVALRIRQTRRTR
ncbi:MAG: family 16 glycosylhydrolase [Propionibacteriaceae bacterium]|nr:family 16 glycosylhydrolase [Propionibacteriaceae bacterium]